MTTSEVKKLLKEKGLKWTDLKKFMSGQTVSMKNGEINYFHHDVAKFISGGYKHALDWD